MNAFTMISGIIFSGMLLFSGRNLQRYLAYVRMIYASGTAVIFLLVSLIYEPEMIVQHGTAVWAAAVTSSNSLTVKIVFIALPIVCAILAAYTVHLFPRITNRVGIFFTLAFTVVFIGSVYLPSVYLIIIALTSGALALFLRYLNADIYHIIATSVTGGVLFSFLVTRFYYLPLWVAVLLALGGFALGLAIQRYEYRKEQVTDE